MGFTAASLGASEVVLLEGDRAACKHLRTTIQEAQRRLDGQELSSDFSLLSGDLAKLWPRLESKQRPSHVWADPPYDSTLKWVEFLLKKLQDSLADDGTFILEAASKDRDSLNNLFSLGGYWDIVKEKHYGDSLILMGKRR